MMTAKTEVKFQNQGELAIVRVLGNGRIEVERDGKATKFAEKHTFEDVQSRFKAGGWEPVVENKQQPVTAEVQAAVDLYLELKEKEAALKKQMDSLKDVVKPFMEQNSYEAIKGTQGKQVYLQQVTASNSTSLYSNYEPAEVLPLLPKEYYNDVMEGRINSDKLEALLKLDKLPGDLADSIKSCKIIKAGTPQFRVKK
jgi:hypothetical protein